MMKKTKLFTALLIFTSLLLLLSGCGSSKDSNGAASASKSITLDFWGGVPAENGPQAAVDEWNKSHPDIQVTYHRYVNDENGNLKLNNAIQTNQDVDIVTSYSPEDYLLRVKSNFFNVIDQKEFNIEKKIGSAAKEYQVNGKYYGIPTNVNGMFIMLNEDLLKEKGLDVPDTMTWADLKKYADTLKGSVKYPYAIEQANIYGIIQNALIDKGFVNKNGKSNLDDANVRKGLQLYHDMMKEKEMPELSVQKATNMNLSQMFLKGDIGMYQAGAWRLRDSNNLKEYPRKFKIAFVPYPNFKGQSTPDNIVQDTMSIVRSSKHPKEALEFIKWYADKGIIHLAPGGRVPASVDGPKSEATKQIVQDAKDTYNLDSLNKIYTQSDNKKSIEKLPKEVIDNINQEIEKYFIGDQSLDDTIKNMVAFHNNFLKNNK